MLLTSGRKRLLLPGLTGILLGCDSSGLQTAAMEQRSPAVAEQYRPSGQRIAGTASLVPDPVKAQVELLQLERDYADALITKDRAFLMRFYAPDWRGGNWMGFWTKSDMLKAVLDDRYSVKSMDLKDVRVRVLGRIAIVQGHDDEVTTVNGRDTTGRWTFTDVFEHRDGQWVAIASHTAEVG